jgi:protein O-GlcNAc transferase
VTLPGTMQRGRHTFGMYQAMAWTELVARDGDDYVRLAVRVASESKFRAHCVERIGVRRSVLFENEEIVRRFEMAFGEMMDAAARRQTPIAAGMI